VRLYDLAFARDLNNPETCFYSFLYRGSSLTIICAFAGKRVWGLSRFTTDCASSNWRSSLGTASDQKEVITKSCSQLVLQLHDFYDPEKVGT